MFAASARGGGSQVATAAAVTGAGALLTAAAVHLAQLVSIFHAVPKLAPLFAADVLVSTAAAAA